MNFLTIDFETYYARDYSLSKLTVEQYVRDPRFEVIGVSVKRNEEPPVWFSGTMSETATWLAQWDIPNSFLLAHNTRFDAFILSHHFGLTPRFYFDTMSMARPLHGQTIGVSLKALADKYTIGMKGDEVILALGKHREDFTPVELERYGRYCMNDVQLTYILFQVLKKEIPAAEIKIIDMMLRMFVEPQLELDPALLTDHLATVREKKAALLATVEQIAGKNIFMSNPKFALLLKQLGVDPPMKISKTTQKETYAFGKTDVEFKALLDHEDPRVQAVVTARLGLKSTLEESRTLSFIELARRGPLPVPLAYYKAHTGRAAGDDGINLQNLPRGGALRKAIRAPEGFKLVACDSAQIEARVLAWLAGQKDLVQAFADKADVYSMFASEVYGRPIDRKRKEIDENGKETYPDAEAGHVGKTCILGLGYGTGGEKLQQTLKVGKPPVSMTMYEAARTVDLYRTKYSKIPRLWKKGEAALKSIVRGEEFRFGPGGLLYTSAEGIHLPNGMVIRYPGLVYDDKGGFAYARDMRQQAEWVKQKLSGKWNFDTLTRIYGAKVIENVVQALARIVVFDQMLNIGKDYQVVLTVHDEVVVCVADARAGEALQHMITIMSAPPAWASDLPIACEGHIGQTYGDAK